jgi:hypothetical protein
MVRIGDRLFRQDAVLKVSLSNDADGWYTKSIVNDPEYPNEMPKVYKDYYEGDAFAKTEFIRIQGEILDAVAALASR